MRRRNFLGVLGGAAVTWPLATRAQERMRRVGVLMPFVEGDLEGLARIRAFENSLREIGWNVGRNLQMHYRWSGGTAQRARVDATELIALAPDVILATGGATVSPLQEAGGNVPIVFVRVTDPVGAGYVASLARPGGNATGFANFEYGISTKWLEILKQIAPRLKRVAVLRDITLASGPGQLGALQGAAASFGVELMPINVRDAKTIESTLEKFAEIADGGLIVVASAPATVNRKLILELAARYRLPAIYPFRHFAIEGGLIFYGPDSIDQYRRAAIYVDRILKGEKPADLPVQTPTKFELVINLKTAKTLGLTVPSTLVARADEVIE